MFIIFFVDCLESCKEDLFKFLLLDFLNMEDICLLVLFGIKLFLFIMLFLVKLLLDVLNNWENFLLEDFIEFIGMEWFLFMINLELFIGMFLEKLLLEEELIIDESCLLEFFIGIELFLVSIIWDLFIGCVWLLEEILVNFKFLFNCCGNIFLVFFCFVIKC